MTVSSDEALKHLNSVRPNDGWKVQKSSQGCRLIRRNIPVSESHFLDVHLTAKKVVVGIISHGASSSQVQELVDAKGRPLSSGKVVSIRTYKGQQSSRSNRAAPSSESISDAQNMALLKYGGLGFLGIMILQMLKQAMLGLYILALPLLYLYLVSKCPSEESFDVRKEVKRVLRGHHLPEDDPNKPKGFLSETLARMTASVTTEVALSAMGYEATIVPLAGAALVASVQVPAAKTEFYWIGIHEHWYYVYSTEMANQ